MVGDPGIEPGVSRLEGVTVPCHTLRPVAHWRADYLWPNGASTAKALVRTVPFTALPLQGIGGNETKDDGSMKKPKWVIAKEQAKRLAAQETMWLFGLHAVRDALENPNRQKLRLVVTRNALERLGDAVAQGGLVPEMSDPRKFAAPLDPQSVHQGAALEVKGLEWGSLEDVALGDGPMPPRIVLLDRVTDPHNVGAILRSAEVFGARAVVAVQRHSAPETGALAKTASGALERQPYVRVRNLADAMEALKSMGYLVLGLDGEADSTIEAAVDGKQDRPVALVLGAEGPGLREKTRETCDMLVRIDAADRFGSLNVSNAAAVALYAVKG